MLKSPGLGRECGMRNVRREAFVCRLKIRLALDTNQGREAPDAAEMSE